MSVARDTAVRGNLAARLQEFRDSIRRDHLLWVVIALGPVFALFCIIRVYPILETIRLSFYRYHPTQRNRPFIGLDNYWRLLEDEAFHSALINTLQFCVMAVVITLLLAFAVAVLLRSIEKVAPIYELLLYIPVVTPWVPASVIWKWIFDPVHGILNYLLALVGLPKLAWLQDEHVILYAIVLVSVWKMLGYFVVVYGVGLRNIPDELLEAAELDGATPWQRLIYVVIPMMKPIILFTVIIATIIFFNVFAPVYVLTASAQGAPAYDLKVVIGEIYQNAFVFYRMGYAGAQSVALLAFVLCLVAIQFTLFREKGALMFKERPVVVTAYLVCTVMAVLAVTPFFWVLMTALKPNPEINAWPPNILPVQPTLDHFHRILAEENFLRYILNSLIIALSSMTAILFTSSIAGFIFAKYRFPGRGILFAIILATAIIPLEVYIIPLYLMVFGVRMMNSYLSLVFPFVIMTFGVFFMRQVIMAIPDELLEAARIDGASEFWIYVRVVLALSKSGLMALGVFAFSEAWANFIWPLVVVTTKDMYTTELGLATYQRQFYIEYGPISAGAVISIMPMLIVFALLRSHIMKGIATSGLRG